MSGCKWFSWNNTHNLLPQEEEPKPFSLPSPIPKWPQGGGFASGIVNLGEIEVSKITELVSIWSCNPTCRENKGVTFYRPLRIPEGFHCLGHYCQPNEQPLRGYLLVARQVETDGIDNPVKLPALIEPLDYSLIWTPDDGIHEEYTKSGFIWLPQPPDGYKSVGYVVTNRPNRPELAEVRCVRADLTDTCETYRRLLNVSSNCQNILVQIWSTRPCHRGMLGKGVPVGTFYCTCEKELPNPVACLKNLNSALPAMPTLNQIHALINHYGPTVFFHPEEIYLPSSVSWFFKNGAVLHRADNGMSSGEPIDDCGTNLPRGGSNDRQFWVDLPLDDRRVEIIYGNLESARVYVNVKPVLGGTFTDIAMWVFCPFNGPATLKIGIMSCHLEKIGRHVGDWEHFTLRICNFTGEIWSIYFSQHSGGQWVDAYDLEFIEGNKAIVYSSKSGHASYPHAGVYIQGCAKLGIGIRNDCSASNLFIDSSIAYEIVAAQYLGVVEPCWLQFMREWGPTIVYSSRKMLDKMIGRLPSSIQHLVANICRKFPGELLGEGGPTGPKEKNNWEGDERG